MAFYMALFNSFMEYPVMQNEYSRAIVVLLSVIILAKLAYYIIKVYVTRLTSKTRTDIDDIIIARISKPIYTLIIFMGLYFALKSLTMLEPYLQWINIAFYIIIVFIVTSIITHVLSVVFPRWMKVHKKYDRTPRLLTKVVNVIIYIIALLIILDHFDVQITPIIATLGVGGLAVGLALQNTLSNFFAGLHILTDKPVKVGDYIELENASITGTVDDIGWRSTRIRTLANQTIIIPNNKLAESVITNLSLPDKEMSLPVECGVAYGSNLEKVEKVTLEIAKMIQKKTKGAVKAHTPSMRFTEFGDSNINFSVFLRIDSRFDKYPVRHEFIKALKKEFDKKKIEISWPVVKVVKGK